MGNKFFKPPLPFLGNKRGFIKLLDNILRLAFLEGKINNETLIIDLFGGSGLLSHNIKRILPANRVIWNDYDNYKERLDNIETTEKHRQKIREISFNSLIFWYNKKRLPSNYLFDYETQAIKDYLQKEQDKGSYLDLTTISTWLLFGGCYYNDLKYFLNTKRFYTCFYGKDLNADGYLEGVERVSCDYKELLEKYKNNDNVLFVADPPLFFYIHRKL